MAVKKTTKVSAEEQAVLDARAQFEKDFAASTAAVNAMQTGQPVVSTAVPAVAPTTTAAKPAVPTGSNYGAFTESPLYQYNTLSQQAVGSTASGTTTSKNTATTPTVISTYTDANGNQIAVMSDGTTKDLGKTFTAADQTKQINAITNLQSLFTSYGIGPEIATALAELVKKGYDSDTISSIAQDPTSKDPVAIAFQKRFAGNAGRIKMGLAPFDPSTYLNVEKAFSEAVRAAGLPAGFYDNQSDWADWIGKGVSPAEATRRVNLASDVLINKDPSYLEQMQNLYGLDKSHALAYLLDSDKALPLIEKQVNAVKFASAAQRAGMGVNKTLAEQYADLGVTEAEAEKGFRSMAATQAERQRLAAIEGKDTGAVGKELLKQTFTGGAGDIGNVGASEIGRFSGSAGAGKGSLGVDEVGII